MLFDSGQVENNFRLTLETGFLYFTSIDALQLNWNDYLLYCYRQTTNTTNEQFQFSSLVIRFSPGVLVCRFSIDGTHWWIGEKPHLYLGWLFTLQLNCKVHLFLVYECCLLMTFSTNGNEKKSITKIT